ncbi:Inner membrane metabolite transport protein YhjE [Brevundimonas sp. NIBR10]|uniref:MFS transporter n=1 Tax=Brevundimonas sp. NIBR10 TaxID=3015997 RepID=UPI0022F159DB|nr:MFS transporter [Brevundimonas sp. NIBR10]WGM47558.1 Inner membrane metabolite transport protein YhjE [Brevundimonas sp. NIBR10]
MTDTHLLTAPSPASTRRVLFASLIGTTIEFFDFYIYATAAVLVFPALFFPGEDATTAQLQSFATFGLAFFARPVGAVVFGHFGDRVGRKATLVAALMTMGLSTVAIGLLPTYQAAGIIAPLLLALCRFGQGFGLGGEWGGAVLLATENAPPGRKAWFGMFPQLGAPIGFVLSTGSFLILTGFMAEDDFLAWGWRLPFLASAVLVLVGLWVRLRITETPEFSRVIERAERVKAPILTLLARYKGALILGTLGATTTFLLFYLMTVFALSWATSSMGYTRGDILPIQLIGVLFFGAFIPISALAADKWGQLKVLGTASVGIGLFGLTLAPLFSGGLTGLLIFFSLGFALMGATYGPLSAAMARPFRTAVRYTGASMAFNLAGIVGASVAPFAATWLAKNVGLPSVGLYLAAASVITLLALIGMGRLKVED